MLDAIDTATQIIAAIGVIAGLFFVGAQIRQNTKAVRSASFHAVTDSFNEVNIAVAANPELGRLTHIGFSQGLGALSPEEQTQFGFIALSAFRVMETLFYHNRLGFAEDPLWEAEQNSIKYLISLPGIREWWGENQLSFTQDFRELVQAAIQELN